MCSRLLAAILLVLGFSAAAHAEINSDTGCDSSGAWMTQPTSGSGVSVTGSKCVFSDVRSMHMLMQMTPQIKKGHRYRLTFDLTGYSGTGSVRGFVGITMPATPAGSWVLASSQAPVADRFTWGLGKGIESGGVNFYGDPRQNVTGPGLSGENIGSFRLFCTHGKFGWIDPILTPGFVGGHIHEFIGNTDVQPGWVYSDFRTKGASSCQDSRGDQAKYPVNPSGYWFPALIEDRGSAGLFVVKESQTLIYYKGPSAPSTVIDYTKPSPFGGLATANGTTTIIGNGSGYDMTLYNVGTQVVIGPPNTLTGSTYTVASHADSTHLTLTTTVAAGSVQYGLFPYATITGASTLCNEEWGMGDGGFGTGLRSDGGVADLYHDQNGNAVTDESRCPQYPPGMRFIFGFNKADPTHTQTNDNSGVASPAFAYGAIDYQCWPGPNGEGGSVGGPSLPTGGGGIGYHSFPELEAAIAANPTLCPLGAQIHVGLGAPECWDGQHIDSPNHRDHVAYSVSSSAHNGTVRCPVDHPYPLPHLSLQNYYPVDQALLDGKWRWSIDEMVDGLTRGTGAHMDYIFAWSPTASAKWFTNCVHPHNSCTHDMGDGTQITHPTQYDGTSGFANGFAKPRPDRYVSSNLLGMSRSYSANGSYSVDLTSPGDGVFGFFGLAGFNGSIDNIHIVEISQGGHG